MDKHNDIQQRRWSTDDGEGSVEFWAEVHRLLALLNALRSGTEGVRPYQEPLGMVEEGTAVGGPFEEEN